MDDSLIVGRVVERLLITLFGGISLAFGWNLFRVGVANEQVAELAKADLKVKLQKVGPGVFFALFGTLVLIAGLLNPLRVSPPATAGESATPELGTFSYLSGSEVAAKQTVQSLNTLLDIVPPESEVGPLVVADVADLASVRPEIEALRNDIARGFIGEAAFDAWRQWGQVYLSDESRVPSQQLPNLRLAHEWLTLRAPVAERATR